MNADQIEELAEKMLTLATVLDDIACDVRAMCPGLVDAAARIRAPKASVAPVEPEDIPTQASLIGWLWAVGLSTEQIALMCGVHKTSVWSWSRDKPMHRKNLHRLREVCVAHGIDPVRAQV